MGFLFAGKCPPVPMTEFADVAAETYPVHTKLYYVCDEGYRRRSGQYLGIRCQNISGTVSWVYKEFECIDEKILFSNAPMVELNFTQETRKTQSPAPPKQENLSGFCGTPKTVPHASLKKDNDYSLGQVLYFKCQAGYDKRPPISGTRTCKKVNGKNIWTPLNMRCTNDSSIRDEWLSPVTEPDMSDFEQHPVQCVSGSAHPSFSSSVILPVTAIFFVLLTHSAVFV
uniref:Interleukin-2 receptor subunit alpha n=1 Tax=Anas zonorhyncha TaxID=75864 RepID=A0A8B9V6T5_9AVES